MLKLCRVDNVKVFVLVLVYVFAFDLFECSASISEMSLKSGMVMKRDKFLCCMFLFSFLVLTVHKTQ